MHLSILIPLYNEESLIIDLLKRLIALPFPNFIKQWEIIVVDDCSTDNSYNTVAAFIQNDPSIHLFKHTTNQGKGAAVRTAISNAKGSVYLIQDADLELNPSDIPSMLNAMHQLNVQFINGSRYLPGVVRPLASYSRYLANKTFSFITSILVNVRITDMACGYKLIHKDLYKKIVLKENRFGFEAELILKALKIKRNNIAEVPVQYFPRNNGEGKKFKTIDGVKIIFTILKYGFIKQKE